MPELPEVETYARQLRAHLVGRTISSVQVLWDRTVATGVPGLTQRLPGQAFTDIGRRGKYLVLALSGGDHLLVHLKMSGRLRLEGTALPSQPHDRVTFTLDNGIDLRFNDTRKFGRMYLVNPADDPVTLPLGPEPLAGDFALDDFRRLIRRRTGSLKPLLTNQSFLAGLGNIYVDEALYRARLHPLRKASSLVDEETEALYSAIRDILRVSIECQGTSFDFLYTGGMREGSAVYQSFLQVYGRKGQRCPRCSSEIVRIVVGGRGTHICPICQPLNNTERSPKASSQGG